jgi:hypothetical protein
LPAKQVSIAEALGVPLESVEADIKLRRPEDPEKAQRDHDRGMLVLKMGWGLSIGALALAFALCWLFLYYGKPEQAEKVVATLVGLVGGIGIGRGWAAKD